MKRALLCLLLTAAHCSLFGQSALPTDPPVKISEVPRVTSAATSDSIPINTDIGGGVVKTRIITVGNLSLAVTPAFSQITGTPTTLSGYGITDAQPLDPIASEGAEFRFTTHNGNKVPLGIYTDVGMTTLATAEGDVVLRWVDPVSGAVLGNSGTGNITLHFADDGTPVLLVPNGAYFGLASRSWFPSKRGALYWSGRVKTSSAIGGLVETFTPTPTGTRFFWYATGTPVSQPFSSYAFYDGSVLRDHSATDFGWQSRALVRTADTTAKSYRNGALETTLTVSDVQYSDNPAAVMSIAGEIVALGYSENGTHSPAIEAYFRSLNPVATPTRKIAFVGNSLTAGNGTSNPSTESGPAQFEALVADPLLFMRNFGVPSATGAQLNTASTGAVALAVAWLGASGSRVAVVDEVTNSLYFGASAATAYADLVTACTTLKNAGAFVIVKTPRPRTHGGLPGTFEADRQTVITNIRANWLTFADALADLAGDSRIGDATDSDDLTYYNADKVHMVAAGYAVDASITKAAYDEIFRTSYLNAARTVFIKSGTGDPEGVVPAGIGSKWLRTDGGAGTTEYVKESGTGKTGWAAK